MLFHSCVTCLPSVTSQLRLRSCARLLRLRSEVQRLITTQAGRISDPAKSSAYLKNQYEQILSVFTVSFLPFTTLLHDG